MPTNTRRSTIVASPSHCQALLTRIAKGSFGEPIPVLFKRNCHRWALQAPAVFRYRTGSGEQVVLEGTVQDLSASGMGLLCTQSVPVGAMAEVFVLVRNFEYSAAVQVVHVTAVPEGARIGCEFVVREESPEAL